MLKNTLALTRLKYGTPYCEKCRDTLAPGMLVHWISKRGTEGAMRKTPMCATCYRQRREMGRKRRGRR